MRYDQAALDTMAAAPERLRDVFASAGIGLDVPGPFHELRPGSSVHYGGSDPHARTTPSSACSTGGTGCTTSRNVVVADSSCFTTGPEKNPTLTAMAIAIRAADHLADDMLARDSA